MNIRLVATVCLTLCLMACAQDSGKAGKESIEKAPSSRAYGQTAAIASAHSFAALPDRGDLIVYPSVQVHREGRSTWRRADVSEEHALRAIASGRLRFTDPEGRLLEYVYQRHIEHSDGNWTWVGELAQFPGREAVITFGEHAAFGLFSRPGAEPLRMTVREGVAWIVELDPKGLRGVDATEAPDFAIPGNQIAQLGAMKQAAAAQAEATTAASTPTVDIALGYTSTFATGLGGQSQAVTRLTHLIDLTNQAYVRSGLNAQVRLVRTMQVSYPNATTNDSALYDLTGSDGESPVTIPSSLQPLRQAREQYGADLVSLVRKYDDATHTNCGIAWVVGGGGDTVTSSYAPWGYSVVGDGIDNGRFCRDETLAHELGHNMGQAHNIEDSGGDQGAHPYSYGYREASATGFYTIMAYRSGDSQFSIPYFANPNVTYSGRVTGIANMADNVRSMAQIIPIIATFRFTVVPMVAGVESDVDGNGTSDILLRTDQLGTGNFAVWLMDGAQKTSSWSATMAASYRIAATGDFNGDGKLDVAWTSANRDVRIWTGTGSSFSPSFPTIVGTYPSGWILVSAGDVNGDGKDDLLLRTDQLGTGNFIVWLMNGTQKIGTLTATMAASYRIAATGDFNGDDKLDIAWTSANRDVRVWTGTGTSFTPAFPTIAGTYSSGWALAGAGDVNGDGRDDLLLRTDQLGTGNVAVWLMNGTQRIGSWTATMAASYWLAATGDYNGDGKLDLVWTSSNRDVRTWLGTGTSFTPAFPTIVGTYPTGGWALVKSNL